MKQFNCRVGLVCHAQPNLQASTGPVYNMKRKAGLVSFRYKKKRTQKQQKKNTTKKDPVLVSTGTNSLNALAQVLYDRQPLMNSYRFDITDLSSFRTGI